MFSKINKPSAAAERTEPAPAPAPARTRGQAMPAIISEDMSVQGDLSGTDEIQIEGRVEGTVACGSMVIGQQGRVEGKVSADAVRIAGTFRGEIKADTVAMTATARVEGDIEVRSTLSIELGAVFEGQTRRTKGVGAAGLDAPKMPAPKIVVAG